MQRRHKAELVAGLFLNFGLAIAMLSIFLFGSNLRVFSRALHYRFIVPNAEGVLAGTKVLIAGVDAGKVTELTLEPSARGVRVNIDIAPKFQNSIREDSYVDLGTQGLLGDKIVVITPGSGSRPTLPSGSVLPTRISPSLSQLVGQGHVLVEDLDRLTLDIDAIVGGFRTQKTGKKIAASTSRTLENLSELTGRLNRELDVRKLDDSLTKLDSILGKIDDGQGTLGALVNDPSIYDAAKAVMGEANRNRIVRNLVRKSVGEAETQKAGNSG